MSLPTFQLLRPKTLDDACRLMAKHDGDVKVVAGGTDLLPSMKQKLFTPAYVLDLRGSQLSCVVFVTAPTVCEIGALTTLTAVEHSPVIRRDYPGAVRGGKNRGFAGIAQYGHAWVAMSAWTLAVCGTTSRLHGARVAVSA